MLSKLDLPLVGLHTIEALNQPCYEDMCSKIRLLYKYIIHIYDQKCPIRVAVLMQQERRHWALELCSNLDK